jgi:hypothetical protein
MGKRRKGGQTAVVPVGHRKLERAGGLRGFHYKNPKGCLFDSAFDNKEGTAVDAWTS